MDVIIVALFFILFFLGMPIGYILSLTGIYFLWQSNLPHALILVPERFFAIYNSFPLLAMPFFMLCGFIMDSIGITDKILEFSKLLVGRLQGGLGHMNILASTFFAGLSGSGLADIFGLGAIEIPMMEKGGYDTEYATAITVASAMVGPIIPPSIILVLYGSIMNVSIGGLFAAGVPTGLLLSFNLMIANAVISKKRNYPIFKEKYDKEKIFKIIMDTLPALGVPIIILGGIFFGIVTPTEAGGVALLYILIIGFFLYRSLNLKIILSALTKAIRMSGIISLLIGSSGIIGWYITSAQVPDKLGKLLLSITTNASIVIFIINVTLLFVGMFMDLTAALLIFSPIVAPIAIKMGFHPLHIGMVICLNLNFGMMTPPLGTGLFAGSIIGRVQFEKLVKAIFPLLCVNIATLFIIIYFPGIFMWLPRYLGFID